MEAKQVTAVGRIKEVVLLQLWTIINQMPQQEPCERRVPFIQTALSRQKTEALPPAAVENVRG